MLWARVDKCCRIATTTSNGNTHMPQRITMETNGIQESTFVAMTHPFSCDTLCRRAKSSDCAGFYIGDACGNVFVYSFAKPSWASKRVFTTSIGWLSAVLVCPPRMDTRNTRQHTHTHTENQTTLHKSRSPATTTTAKGCRNRCES